jgi:hypothetical protein
LGLVDPSRHDAAVGAEADAQAEESGRIESSPVVDPMERREVALDVIEMVEYPDNFSGPF